MGHRACHSPHSLWKWFFYILPIISAVREDSSIYLGIILLLFGGVIPGVLYILWYGFKASSPESKKYKYGLEEYSTEIELTKAAKTNGQVIEKASKDDIKIYYKK